MNDQTNDAQSNLKETSRLEAFSDGVFAIAITLLILELIQTMYPHSEGGLPGLLLNHWQSFLAFAMGFLTILICWINHHLVFEYIKKTDSKLMWVNGFVLLVVTFTPFPTAVLAEYFESESNTALAFFGFNYFMMSVAAYGICAYPFNKHLIEEGSREVFNGFRLMYAYSIIYTLLTFFVCFFSVAAAIFFYCILFVVFAFPKEFSKKLMVRKNRK
ncbi:MAG: DUF1211 domain-containing protein [Chitinophagaceae bacterium]|nr:DUF1211 domain-containing protein [Chitinophagaceae bacterium]